MSAASPDSGFDSTLAKRAVIFLSQAVVGIDPPITYQIKHGDSWQEHYEPIDLNGFDSLRRELAERLNSLDQSILSDSTRCSVLINAADLALTSIPSSRKRVVRVRFGLVPEDPHPHTPGETGHILHVSIATVLQNETAALRSLRTNRTLQAQLLENLSAL